MVDAKLVRSEVADHVVQPFRTPLCISSDRLICTSLVVVGGVGCRIREVQIKFGQFLIGPLVEGFPGTGIEAVCTTRILPKTPVKLFTGHRTVQQKNRKNCDNRVGSSATPTTAINDVSDHAYDALIVIHSSPLFDSSIGENIAA